LDEHIARRSDELKDRALRRRVRRVVGALLERAKTEQERDRSTAEADGEQRRAVGLAGAALERDPDAGIPRLTEALMGPAVALRLDLSQVLVGRDKSSAAQDPLMRQYVMARTLEALSEPLATALSSLSGPATVSPSDLIALSRALLRGAIASTTAPNPEIDVVALARAAVATLVEHLFALSSSTPAMSRTRGMVRELTAFEIALT
jgi:hypothetical protein